MLLQLTVDPGPQLRPGHWYGMDAAFMSLERNALSRASLGRAAGRRAGSIA